MLKFQEKAKWDAWNSLKGNQSMFFIFKKFSLGVSSEEAKKKYIELVITIAKKYNQQEVVDSLS
jgi:acyl-CoA-binding protein